MTLFLVQHGQARPGNEDLKRFLTEHGVKIVEQMADWAARTGIKVDQIRHSGRRRAQQTASTTTRVSIARHPVRSLQVVVPQDEGAEYAKNALKWSLFPGAIPIMMAGNELERISAAEVTPKAEGGTK